MINRSRPIVCVLTTVKVHGNVVNAKYIVRMIALKYYIFNDDLLKAERKSMRIEFLVEENCVW